jgi:phosphatidylserine decarboxylase
MLRSAIGRLLQQEDLNFLLTNRIPRRVLTRFMGWFSRIEQPLVRDASIALWRLFSDVDLADARKQHFSSLHDCFVRELKEGARPIDPDPTVLVSPCDGIVGAFGRIEQGTLLQAKGMPYALADLVCDAGLAHGLLGGCYVTLRLTAGMYHRFHAPADCRVAHVTHVAGDVWNVNPPTLRRVPGVFCRNERAVITARLAGRAETVLLVPVAAVLVASIRLHFADVLLHLRDRGENPIPCDAALTRGQEMGWFEHGSTIIVLAPAGFAPVAGVRNGTLMRVGRPLLRLP